MSARTDLWKTLASLGFSLATLLAMGIGTLLLFVLSMLVAGEDRASTFANTFFIQCLVFCAVVPATWLANRLSRLTDEDPRSFFALSPASWLVVGLSAVMGASLTVPLGVLDNVYQLLVPVSDAERQMMMGVYEPASQYERVFIVLALVGAAPLGEELLFRGAMLTWLREGVGRHWALVVTAILFAVAHVISSPRWVPLILPVGFVLGWLVLRTGSLASSIAAHAAFNGLPFLTFWSGGSVEGWNDPSIEEAQMGLVWILAGSAVFVASAASIWLLTRDGPPEERIDDQPGLN